jgi:hypothetical protein
MLFQPKLLHIVKQDMYMIVKSQEVKKLETFALVSWHYFVIQTRGQVT